LESRQILRGESARKSRTNGSISISGIGILEIKLYITPVRTLEHRMSGNVVYLHPKPEPVAHYLRLGAFHRQVEKLLAAGRLPVERVVVEASAFTHQKDVIGQLVDAGRELVLDTNAAEFSVVGCYGGAAKSAPWAHLGRAAAAGALCPGKQP
jgi:hypothetical protein